MEKFIIDVGFAILPQVQTKILALITKTTAPIVAIITPFIKPVLIALGIVIAAAAIAYFTYKVAEWIMGYLKQPA
ncbi:MAG: hypothetical protein P4L49_18880 [Desulfosporosinus sp.]|nr:hypothetical protein [Desulfosporosinus sp.]